MKNLRDHILAAKQVLVLAHYNPDGDAVGASLAIFHYIMALGKEAVVMMPNEVPGNLRWMPGAESILVYQRNTDLGNQIIAQADLIICADFQSLSRIDSMEKPITESKAFKILIDHHIEPNREQFDYVVSTTDISSTCELVFQTIKNIGDQKLLTRDAASCIYAGIATDTGSFSFSCNRRETFDTVADLIDMGIDPNFIHRAIFDTFSEDRLRLLGLCLSERMKVMPEYSTAYIHLTKEDLLKYNYQSGDTEGVVNFALSMKDVLFAAFFTETERRIRISFRSKGAIDTNVFARDHFNGGGHKNASGGSSFDSLSETLQKFEELLPEFSRGFKS